MSSLKIFVCLVSICVTLLTTFCLHIYGSISYAAESSWKQFLEAGDAATKKRNFVDAQREYALALKKAEHFSPADGRLVRTLDNMASAYLPQGKYAEAELLYKRALTIKESTLAPSDPDLAKGLTRLAQTYVLEKKYEEAEPLLQRASVIRQKTAGSSRIDVAKDLNNLAVCYLNNGKYSKAEQLLNEAIKISPTYDLAYLNRHLAREKLGNRNGADEDLATARRLGWKQ